MIDDAWIAEVQRRAAPLRVVLPPWGEVLAREALRAPPREASPRRGQWKIAALALAAAACAVWAWPRPAPPPDPITYEIREDMIVATPIVERLPVENTPPIPDPIEDALAPVATPEPPPPPRVPRRGRRPTPPKDATLSVDCILDPRLCPPTRAAAPSDHLPETLGTTEIKRGIDLVRPQFNDCARVHGAAPEQRVKIKFTIEGATGSVVQANVVDDEVAAGLAQCLLAAMHRATFPHFRKERLGVVFPINLP